MRKIELKSRKSWRKILGVVSFIAIVFIFSGAECESDPFYDVRLTGTVKLKSTNIPIEWIRVIVNEGFVYGFTDKKGKFDFYASIPKDTYYQNSVRYSLDSVRVLFLDDDGKFIDKTMIVNPIGKNEVIIHAELEEK